MRLELFLNDIRARVGNRFTSESATYLKCNSVLEADDPEQARLFPDEFLQSLNVSGMPPHVLVLKVEYPVMLLRNLAPEKDFAMAPDLSLQNYAPM